MFKVAITSSARKAAKKLPEEVRKEVVRFCEDYISKDPFDSEKLQKPLDECRSFHFKMGNVHYRIAYRTIEDEKRIDIVLVGSRENFYKRLKQVLR